MSNLFLYLVVMLDNLKDASGIFALIATLAIVFTFIAKEEMCLEEKRYKRYLRVLVAILSLTISFAVFCPSSKQAALLYILPKIMKEQSLQEVPKKILQLIENQIAN